MPGKQKSSSPLAVETIFYSPMSLVLKTSVNDGKLSVTVQVSRLDAAIARDFKAGVDAAWNASVNQVEINLAAVDFVDSSGVGALLSVYRKLPQGTGVTRLTHVKPGVQAVLELLRLHRVFELGA
jgi:anti-sigma B factor antagonist